MFHTRLHVPIPARKSPVPCSPPFTQHAASPHTPRCIGLRSTEHRLTLHVASPHAPRCINPPYSEPIFLPYEMPFPSCMLRFHRNLPALFVHFPPVARASRAFSLRPSVSRLASRLASCLSPSVPPLSRPVCCDSIATCPRFPPASRLLPALPAFPPPSACLPICPRFLLLSPAWPGGNTEKALRDCSRRASD